MKNLFILLLVALFISACTFKKVQKHHGVHFLKKKQEMLIVNKSNKNDIISLLGAPSTKSAFDNHIWIYIERKIDHSLLGTLGQEKIVTNNILLLEINEKGILKKKEILQLKDMNKLKFAEGKTNSEYQKNTFIYDFLSSLRQKINDPLGKRKR